MTLRLDRSEDAHSGQLAQSVSAFGTGHRASVCALVIGVVAALGFPPLHLWPLTLIAMAAMLWLLEGAPNARRAFGLGWLFGLGHFTAANSWIANAFQFQEAMPVWLGMVVVPLLAVYLAIYPGLATLGAYAIAKGKAGGKAGRGIGLRAGFGTCRTARAGLVLALAGSWIVSEWLRSWVFTGFAWNPLGLVFLGGWEQPGIALLAQFTGTYALSGLVVLAAGALWIAFISRSWIAAMALAGIVATGMLLPPSSSSEGSVPFTLVQPNLKQEDINDARLFEEQFATIAALSLPREQRARRLVLWPESAIPDYIEPGYPQRYYRQMTAGADPAFARFRIARTIGEGGVLLTGNVDLEIGEVDGHRRAVGAYNSVTALDDNGDTVARYAKAHLVPYGEYLALRWLLEPLGATRLVAGTIDFIPGPGPRTLALGEWGRAGIQICYEIIFSGQVVDRDDRPDYIFNPTNDGWFGAWGPPQHLAQARLRAIEEGLPVLRATTTGISAVIDARGVVRQHIGMAKAARIDGLVPPPAPPTLFSRTGNALPLGLALLLIIASLVASSRARR